MTDPGRGAFEAEHYEQTRRRLAQDPVIWRMAAEIAVIPLAQIMTADGGPVHAFMVQANRVYRDYGGQTPPETHVGGVAETVLRILVTRAQKPERLLSFWLPLHETATDDDPDDVTAVVAGPPDGGASIPGYPRHAAPDRRPDVMP